MTDKNSFPARDNNRNSGHYDANNLNKYQLKLYSAIGAKLADTYIYICIAVEQTARGQLNVIVVRAAHSISVLFAALKDRFFCLLQLSVAHKHELSVRQRKPVVYLLSIALRYDTRLAYTGFTMPLANVFTTRY